MSVNPLHIFQKSTHIARSINNPRSCNQFALSLYWISQVHGKPFALNPMQHAPYAVPQSPQLAPTTPVPSTLRRSSKRKNDGGAKLNCSIKRANKQSNKHHKQHSSNMQNKHKQTKTTITQHNAQKKDHNKPQISMNKQINDYADLHTKWHPQG